MISVKQMAIGAALAGALAFTSACGGPDKLRVKNAVVTLSPVDSNPSALHFTVYGGEEDVRLLSIYSKSAIRSEMHESKMDADTKMMSMEKTREVNIPAGEKVEFKKGSYHGMAWGVNKIARRMGEMEYEFVFSNRDRILVDAVVQEVDGSIPDERKAVTQ